LVARRHEEHVGAGLDEVRERLAESALVGDLLRVLEREAAEELLVIRLAGAEHDELETTARERTWQHLLAEVEALLPREARDDPEHRHARVVAETGALEQL